MRWSPFRGGHHYRIMLKGNELAVSVVAASDATKTQAFMHSRQHSSSTSQPRRSWRGVMAVKTAWRRPAPARGRRADLLTETPAAAAAATAASHTSFQRAATTPPRTREQHAPAAPESGAGCYQTPPPQAATAARGAAHRAAPALVSTPCRSAPPRGFCTTPPVYVPRYSRTEQRAPAPTAGAPTSVFALRDVREVASAMAAQGSGAGSPVLRDDPGMPVGTTGDGSTSAPSTAAFPLPRQMERGMGGRLCACDLGDAMRRHQTPGAIYTRLHSTPTKAKRPGPHDDFEGHVPREDSSASARFLGLDHPLTSRALAARRLMTHKRPGYSSAPVLPMSSNRLSSVERVPLDYRGRPLRTFHRAKVRYGRTLTIVHDRELARRIAAHGPYRFGPPPLAFLLADPARWDEQMVGAATQIQALQRGKAIRRAAHEREQERAGAARQIQGMVRGRASRRGRATAPA